MSFSRRSVHQNIFFLLLAVLVAAMPTSKFLMSATIILFSANWLIEGHFRQKWQTARRNTALQAFVALYLVHVVWCLFSSNWDYALDDLRRKLPLLAIPVVVFTSDYLDRRKTNILLQLFCLTVTTASMVGIMRQLALPSTDYRAMFPHFSHIRFALNVCMAIVIMSYAIYRTAKSSQLEHKWLKITAMMLTIIVYFVVLLLLQSYTAFVILGATFVVLLGWLASKRRRQPKYLATFVSALAVMVVAMWAVFSHYRSNYYTPSELSQRPLATHTANGNAYTHANDGLIEMGGYINNYVCDSELRSQWAGRSLLNIDSLTPNSYAVYPTLVRYLNAKGLTKDSVGVWSLTSADVRLIEQGVANPYYSDNFGMGKMFYRLFFDYECYKQSGLIVNSSLLQRFELWRNGWSVFGAHPVFGVGTGDVADEVAQSLKRRHSQLAGTNMRTHNQYITLLLTFGVVGVAVILFVFCRAIVRQRLLNSALFVAYLCIVLVSFVSEDTLETEAGVVFVSLMFTLLSARATQPAVTQ